MNGQRIYRDGIQDRNKKSRERFSQISFKSSVYAMSDTLDKKRES